MKRLLFLYTFIILFVPSIAQIEENFLDGNLFDNPIWEGDTVNFIVNIDKQLQLKAITSGQSIIYLNTFIEKETEWSLFIKMNFNPSTTNRVRIYLQSDNVNLLNSSGYFLEIGESGENDAIKLYRQDSGNKILLATATSGSVAINPNVRVKVVRENNGKWSVFADYNGGNDLKLEAKVTDSTYFENKLYFFGLHCKYTLTRIDGFFFDDISVNSLKEDVFPPVLTTIDIIDEQTLELIFNEFIDKNTAINPANFFINKNIGIPQSVNFITANQLELNLNKPLLSQETYTISIDNIVDLKGNVLMNFDTVFTFIKTENAAQYDIVINEIMEDPTLKGGGTLGLPADEYVELYNRSSKTINLEGFTFTDGSSKSANFPTFLFLPDTYLIITKNNSSGLEDFGQHLRLPNFPTLSSEEELILKDEFGTIIDVVKYTQNWYQNTKSATGGFSLERINSNTPCEGIDNWRASSSLLGGTPGKKNAINNLLPKELTLGLINAYPIDATHVRLTFNKAINLVDLLNEENYTVSNNQLINITLIENNFNQVIIELLNPLIENKIETIELTTSFSDCIGKVISENRKYNISFPVLATPNDIIINEILYNPLVGGVDFLELKNNSQNVIDLNSLIIINLSVDKPVGKPIRVERLLFPNEYVVFTEKPIDIQNRYRVENPDILFSQDLPTFANKEGNASIYTNNLNESIMIDQFDYSDDFHNALLNDKEGVSLERINPDLPTQSIGNWHSASSTVGYATPTYQNSQAIIKRGEQKTNFILSSNSVSPDGDGFEDFLQINYVLEEEGFSVTIHIYDAVGRLVKKIAQNELLSTTGSFKWNGTTADGQKARVGIYVLWIEYFSATGTVEQMKEAIVVAGKI